MWLFTMVNNRHCGKGEVFQFSDLHYPDTDDFKKISSLFKGTSLLKFSCRSDQQLLTDKQKNKQTDKQMLDKT